MANDKKNESKAKEKKNKVGYKNPPEDYQFQKGQSGNPSGRPKGAKSLKTVIAEKLDKEITIKTEEGTKVMSIREAQALKVHEYSLKGDPRYLKFIIDAEAAYLEKIIDERPQSEIDADIVRKLLLGLFLGELDEDMDEEGNVTDKNGNPVDLIARGQEELARRKKGKDVS